MNILTHKQWHALALPGEVNEDDVMQDIRTRTLQILDSLAVQTFAEGCNVRAVHAHVGGLLTPFADHELTRGLAVARDEPIGI